jgi:superfamily I DNA/RNA helicase
MDLDREQQAVVDSNKSTICIAGPGSGKTRILTEKARKLINSGKNIVCFSFTRAAAAEMSARVPNLPATTIHSYCCGAVGWQVPRGGTTDDAYSNLLHRFIRESADAYKFDWVLVDECQDLNPAEMDVVLSLTGDKIFAVGDMYQSIYGFQGAMGPDVVRRLRSLGCDEVPLHNNYRSCPEIVNMLNRMYKRGLVSCNIKDTGLTAILCRRNDDLDAVSRFLKAAGIPHQIRISITRASDTDNRKREWDVLGPSKLCVSTIHASKGHEYDHVIVYGWQPNQAGEETRVLYVAIARASKSYRWAGTLAQLKREVA